MGLSSKLGNLSRMMGFNPRATLRYVGGLPRYFRDVKAYRESAMDFRPGFDFAWSRAQPLTLDYTADAGGAGGHYFFQDLWAARHIYANRPTAHLDIASRIDGFVAHVLSFMPVQVIDIRPLSSVVPGLSFVQADATNLDNFADDSVESLSCLHAIEHFGLGRYGDPIDPESCFKAMSSMARVLKPGGRLYLSTPVGRQRVEFNAHRVFNPQTILDAVKPLRLLSFSAVFDDGRFVENAQPADADGSRFACGMFELTKDR